MNDGDVLALFLGFEFRRVRSLRGVWRPQYSPQMKTRRRRGAGNVIMGAGLRTNAKVVGLSTGPYRRRASPRPYAATRPGGAALEATAFGSGLLSELPARTVVPECEATPVRFRPAGDQVPSCGGSPFFVPLPCTHPRTAPARRRHCRVVRCSAAVIIIMQRGYIVEMGPAQAVLESPEHPYARLLKESVLSVDLSMMMMYLRLMTPPRRS